MNQNQVNLNQVTTNQMLGLMLLAYVFSFVIRLIWVVQLQDNPASLWNNELMINTNDGYFFAAGVQQAVAGLHMDNPRVFGIWDYGVIFFTTLFVKITPFSLETVILYMPSVISSLVVIPMILIARLYKQTLWGFFAALLGSIAWSYYNRTMTGYYDTDMFSAMAPMFILFFLIKSTIDLNMRSALYAGMAIILYPFLYDQGQSIVYAIGMIYGAYMLWFHRESKVTYISLFLIFLALMPIGLEKPLSYLVHFALLFTAYFVLKIEKLQEQKLIMFATLGVFILFILLGNVFGVIMSKVLSYTIQGTQEGALHFYGVNQTVREAGDIPFETFANRTSGSILGVLLSLLGYILLVIKRPAFILALPLIGIGIFSLWGGLRFTVYAVPIAAMSAIYAFDYLYGIAKETKQRLYAMIVVAFFFFMEQFLELIQKYIIPEERGFLEALGVIFASLGFLIKQFFAAMTEVEIDFFNSGAIAFYELLVLFLMFVTAFLLMLVLENKEILRKAFFLSFLTVLLLIPNLSHIIGYKVPTVLKKAEVQDLIKLDNLSSPKDYTLAWWDYGYPIWYYSDTSTLIDGGKHNNDNFIISTIMQTTSPKLAASLARLSVETYVASDYGIVADTLFHNKKKNQLDPNLFLMELEDETYTLPKKTRDVFLYLPYRMLNIFPTVAVFGNIDLTTGEKNRKIEFYVSSLANKQGDFLTLKNGLVFNEKNGELHFGRDIRQVKYKVSTQERKAKPTEILSKMYQMDAKLVVLEMKSYNKFVVMDEETFNSMYVQMLLLGRYDKNLFELSVSSAYGKIYKLKI